MAAISQTEINASSQALISAVVQQVLKQESILLPSIIDYSGLAQAGNKSVGINRRTQFTAADKVEETDLTAQVLTFSADTIDLNKHKAIYAELERLAAVQAMPNVDQEIIMEMAQELALQVDKDIIVQLKLASSAAPDHILDYSNTPTDTVQAADILEARRLLNVQKVPQADRFMLISPSQEKAMLQIANFIEVDKYGPNEAIANAELGRIYGFRVLMHTELSDADTLFWHRSACGFARQVNPEFKKDMNLKGVKDEYLLHTLYGVKVLDSGKRQVYFNGSGA
jgi:N4-gp56 family major capsid protein